MVLRGVLELSFGNYICIRGFAPLKDLAKYSKIDESYQRRPNKKHVREIADFVKQGEYHYYPEILLGLACDKFKSVEKTRRNVDRSVKGGFEHYLEVKSVEVSLYHALKNMVWPRHEIDPRKCRFYGRHFGDLKVTVGQRKNYFDREERARNAENEDVQQLFLNVAIYGIEKVDGGSPIYCIDGNHRLDAARQELNLGNHLVPFCLILFENEDSCREQGAMLFHNINYHALPVSDERNVRTITERKMLGGGFLFSPERLLSFSSLGRGEYYFVRKTWEGLRIGWEKGHDKAEFAPAERFGSSLFKKIFAAEEDGGRALSFLLSIYKILFDQVEKDETKVDEALVTLYKARPISESGGEAALIPERFEKHAEEFVTKFVGNLYRVDKMICNRSDLKCENQNDAIAAALVALSYYNDNRYQAYFLDYAVKRGWGCVKDLAVAEVLSLFKEQMDRKEKTIFVSMPFYKYACDYHYQVIKEVIDKINTRYKEQLGDRLLDCHRVDRNETGKTFEINQKVADSIAECGLLIADLTYSNVNVFHEVGMLMGRTFAAQGRTNEFDMILLCDESESSVNDVEYNLHSLQIVRFKEPAALRKQLKKRLLDFYKIKPDDEDAEELSSKHGE